MVKVILLMKWVEGIKFVEGEFFFYLNCGDDLKN